MDVLMIVLRALHIVLGVLWAGWAFSLALFVEPGVRESGPSGKQFMQAVANKTKLVQFMTIAPILVILTGIWMFWKVSGGFDMVWIMSVHGATVTVGSLAGLTAFVYGFVVMRPMSMRIAAVSAEVAKQGVPPTESQLAELTSLAGRMRSGGHVAAWLLLISVLLMAVARYVV